MGHLGQMPPPSPPPPLPSSSLTFSSQQWSKVATELGKIKLYITQQVGRQLFLLLTHLKQASNQLQRNHRSQYVLGAFKNNYCAANLEAQEAIFVVVRMQELWSLHCNFSLEVFTKLKALAKMLVC